MESTYCSAWHILRAQSIIANYWVRAWENEEQGAVYNMTKCELVLFCVLIRLNERKGRWPFILFSSASVGLKTNLKKMTLSCFPFFLRKPFWSPSAQWPWLVSAWLIRKWEWAWGRKGLERTLHIQFASFLRCLVHFL